VASAREVFRRMASSRLLFALALTLAGCDCGGGTAAQCTTDSDCGGGERCVDERCAPRPDGGRGADGGDVDSDAGEPGDAGDTDGGVPCGAEDACEGDARCVDGAHRAAFGPHDGQLYVAGADGWGNYAITDGSLARVRYLPDRRHHLPGGGKG